MQQHPRQSAIHHRTCIITVALLLAVAAPAGAADAAGDSPSLAEVTISATKLDLVQAEIPQASTVVTAQQIAAQAQTSVTDTLRQLPGIQFQVAGAPGQSIATRLRGFADSTLYVFDGITLNTGGAGSVGYLLGQLDPTMLQSIEVLRGPHATTYGANSTSGVIAFTTLQGTQQEADLSLEGGSLHWLKGRVGVQNSLAAAGGTWDYSLNGSWSQNDGTNANEFSKNGTVVGRTRFRLDGIEAGGSFYLTDNRFQSADLIESNQGAPAPYFATQVPDPSNLDTTKAGIVSLWFQQQLTSDLSQKLTLGGAGQDVTVTDDPVGNDNLLGSYSAPYDGWTDPLTYGVYNTGDAIPVYQSPYSYKTTNNNYQADYNLRYHTGTVAAVLGTSYLAQYYDEAYYSTLYGNSGGREQQATRSLYGNASLGWFGNTLHTEVGARLDSYTEWQSKATWSTGATYDLAPGLSLYTNYGTSFTQPTLDQLNSPLYGSRQLTPENASTIEAGIRARQLDGALTASLTYWHSYVGNVITTSYAIPNARCGYSDYCGVYVNENAERSQGVEAEFAWKLTGNLTVNGNYTRTDAYVSDGGAWSFMTYTARNMGNLGLTWQEARFDAGTSLYLTDHRLRWAADYWAPGYARLDCFGRWHATPALDLYGRVQNALGRDIVEVLGYRNPGVYFVAGARYRFH